MDSGSAGPVKATQSSCSKQSVSEQAIRFGSILLTISMVLIVVCCQQQVVAANDRVVQVTSSNKNLDQMAPSNSQHADSGRSGAEAARNVALEAELNSIVQQHESDKKMLAEALIARLMLENLTGPSLLSGTNELEDEISGSADFQATAGGDSAFGGQQLEQATVGEQATGAESNGAADTLRLRKWLNILHNYENLLAPGGGAGLSMALTPYPTLPAGQQATMKRAAAKMGNVFLQSQQRQSASPYARNNFDFGLGKRPDSTISGNLLRFGDGPLGSQIQPVGQFGKRPSSHRYDFGLGKRVASPAYPRYDFGLGKRAPNRIRYDFGLGK